MGLSDGSIFSCSDTAKRWLIAADNRDPNKKQLQLVGTYIGHESHKMCAVEIDYNTILTGAHD